MKVGLIVNPTAGSGRGSAIGAEYAGELTKRNITFVLISTNSLTQTLAETKEALASGEIDTIFSVGGDGQAHALFQLAMEYEVAILVVPGGTGNDFARSVGSHKRTSAYLVEWVLRNPATRIDIGVIEYPGGIRYFGEVLSAGFDSQVNRRANSHRKLHGKVRYVAAIFQEIPKYFAKNYALEIDGRRESRRGILLAAANGPTYGGGMKIAPSAKIDDGSLELIFIEPLPLIKFLILFPKVFWGGHIKHPKVRSESFRELHIDGDIWIYADGEEVTKAPAKISVAAGGLLTWRPI